MEWRNKLDHILMIRYEDLVEDPIDCLQRIKAFLPDLCDVTLKKDYHAHNYLNKDKLSMSNLNSQKIRNLNPGQIKVISDLIKRENAVLKEFNYEVYLIDSV